MQGVCPPRPFERVRVVIFAGDHGVARTASTSAYPPEVTAQMVLNFVAGGAAANVLARQNGASVRVVDMAVDADYAELGATVPDSVVEHRVRRSSGSIDREDALTAAEAERAFLAGVRIADEEVDGGADLLIPGDMGIGNTTPAAALTGVLAAVDAASVVGRGTGIDDATWMRKTAAVRDAMRRGRPLKGDPIALLAAIGGADIAAMAGFLVAAAGRRTPVLLDGVVSTRGGPGGATDLVPLARVVAGGAPLDRAGREGRARAAAARADHRLRAAPRRGDRRPRRAAGAVGGRRDPARDGDLRRGRCVGPRGLMPDSLRLALGTLTAIRVPAPRRLDTGVARGAMLLAPAVGLLLGAVAAALVLLVRLASSAAATSSLVALLAAALAIAALAALTRGLHLDGLADTADGLGVKGVDDGVVARRLDVMRSPEVGAFGVVALVLVLLVDVVALAVCIASGYGTVTLLVAVTTSRLAATWCATAGIPAARRDGLGVVVAGSVPRGAALAATVAVLAGAVALGYADDDGGTRVAITLAAAATAGVGGGLALLRRCVRRFGGVTGDVIGAAVETTTSVVLVVLAIAL